jgi:hypothetical protein
MYAHSPPVFDLSFSAAPTPPSPLPPLPLPLLHEGEADDAIYNHLVSCSIFLLLFSIIHSTPSILK